MFIESLCVKSLGRVRFSKVEIDWEVKSVSFEINNTWVMDVLEGSQKMQPRCGLINSLNKTLREL